MLRKTLLGRNPFWRQGRLWLCTISLTSPPFPWHPQHSIVIVIAIAIVPVYYQSLLRLRLDRFPFFYPCHSGLFECIANIICALKYILQMASLPQPYKYHVWWVCIPNKWVLYRHKKAFVCFLTYALQY